MSTVLKSLPVGTGEDRRAVLAERLRQVAEKSNSSPLSFAQQRLWFLDRLEPNSALYNIGTVARISGALEVGALEGSLQAIVARHESLRTRFICVEEDPEQIVYEAPEFKLRVVDLEGQKSEELIRQEVSRPFDLSADLLIRATAGRTGRATSSRTGAAKYVRCARRQLGAGASVSGKSARAEGSRKALP